MNISFGTLFEANKKSTLGKDRTDVVVDVGEADYFYIAGTFQKEGQIAFSLQTGVGTAGRENVERITGQLTLDEMIDAANRGSLEKMGRKLDEGEITSLKGLATRGEREI